MGLCNIHALSLNRLLCEGIMLKYKIIHIPLSNNLNFWEKWLMTIVLIEKKLVRINNYPKSRLPWLIIFALQP